MADAVKQVLSLKETKKLLEKEEMKVSYERRLLQGRLDIIKHAIEQVHKNSTCDTNGEEGIFSSFTLEDFAKLLSNNTTFTEGSRLSAKSVAPEVVLGHITTSVQFLDEQFVKVWETRFEHMPLSELVDYVVVLETHEKRISVERKKLHEKIDLITNQIFSIYKNNPSVVVDVFFYENFHENTKTGRQR